MHRGLGASLVSMSQWDTFNAKSQKPRGLTDKQLTDDTNPLHPRAEPLVPSLEHDCAWKFANPFNSDIISHAHSERRMSVGNDVWVRRLGILHVKVEIEITWSFCAHNDRDFLAFLVSWMLCRYQSKLEEKHKRRRSRTLYS